jgi:hypothetical protein
MDIQIHKPQIAIKNTNPKKSSLRYITSKLSISKKRILKAVRNNAVAECHQQTSQQKTVTKITTMATFNDKFLKCKTIKFFNPKTHRDYTDLRKKRKDPVTHCL